MNQQSVITEEYCQQLVDELAHGGMLHCKLPGGGRLHMDRQVPFLCVYRVPEMPDDSGTIGLVTSQSAYLVVSEQSVKAEGIGRLVAALSRAMADSFGAFLLLEVWAGEVTSHESSRCAFRLNAHDSHSSSELLEAMEAALLRVSSDDRPPLIELNYAPTILPPGRAPLLSTAESEDQRVFFVGLQISPFYRDPDTAGAEAQFL